MREAGDCLGRHPSLLSGGSGSRSNLGFVGPKRTLCPQQRDTAFGLATFWACTSGVVGDCADWGQLSLGGLR